MEQNVGKKQSRYAKPFSLHLAEIDLQPVPFDQRQSENIERESVSYWQDAFRRFRKNKVAMFSLGVIILLILFAFVGPLFSPYTYDLQIRGSEKLFPCKAHPFGTDALGRDMLVRVMVGTRVSLIIGISCALVVLVIGSIYGAISGFYGGKVDMIMMRIADIVYSLPDVLIIIILTLTLKERLRDTFPSANLISSIIAILVAFAIIYWVRMARMVRAQVMLLKQNEYITAARAMGASSGKMIARHLLPNSIGTIIVTTLFEVPSAIFLEAFLGFVGLGVSPPMVSLGSLASDALSGMQSYPYQLFAPAIVICILVLAFNQFGDGLRDALDPKLRK